MLSMITPIFFIEPPSIENSFDKLRRDVSERGRDIFNKEFIIHNFEQCLNEIVSDLIFFQTKDTRHYELLVASKIQELIKYYVYHEIILKGFLEVPVVPADITIGTVKRDWDSGNLVVPVVASGTVDTNHTTGSPKSKKRKAGMKTSKE